LAVAVVGGENPKSQAHLFQVGDATDAVGLGAGFGQGGQKEPRQHNHDDNDHQHLDQGEGFVVSG